MAVLLEDAKASVTALNGVVDAVIKNVQVHDKSHWSKTNAQQALGPPPKKSVCGYYYKETQTVFYTHKLSVEPNRTDPPTKKAAKNWEKVVQINQVAIDVNDCWIIVQKALTKAKGNQAVLRTADTNSRFQCFVPIESYGGVTLYRDGNPAAACTHVVLVIQPGPDVNTSLVTHFPCSQGYMNGYTDLS